MDSGATSHFLVTAAPTTNRQIDQTPLRVRLPDGGQVSSSHTCDLDLPALPAKACIAHIIPGLASHSLLSVVKLCNAGCAVEFTKIACTVRYGGRVVLIGKKCAKTGLWMVPVSDQAKAPSEEPHGTPTEVLNHLSHAARTNEMMMDIYPTSSPADLAQYLHQILCSPPKSTLLKAIRNIQFRSIPGLAYELINDHLPPSAATEKGHMIRTRQ